MLLLAIRMPHVMPAAKAIVNKPVLVKPDSAINSRHQIFVAVLAEPFFKAGRKPDFVFHCNSSCQLNIFVGKPAVFFKHFLSLLE